MQPGNRITHGHERPDARTRIVLLLRDLSEAMDDLQRDFARTAELHTTDVEAVTHLTEGPMSMGTLGRRLSLSPGAVTGLVDRLERIGHARRRPSPTDRRQIFIELQPTARRVVDEYFGALAARVLTLLEGYTDAELMTIERFLTEVPGRLTPEGSAGSRSPEPNP